MSSKVVENYSLMQVIGSGQYGKVYKAVNIKNNSVVAIKVVKIEKFKEVPKLEEFTMNEIQTLARINNPYVVGFIEMLKSSRNYYFVYEFCSGGTLEELIQESGVLPEKDALIYFKQLVYAFQSLVNENILHRDLKPSNVMIHNGIMKLGDFGFCKALNHPDDLSQTMVGSPIYMAPEILKGQDYSLLADLWSLGCVLYEMLYGQCPYEEKTMAQLMQAVDEKDVEFHDNINYVSQATKDLLKRILTKDAKKRMSWKELFEKELTGNEKTLKMNDHQAQQQHEIAQNQQRNKESKAFKFLLLERNKVFYIYKLVEEIIEFSKEERDELREATGIYVGYLMVKYICFLLENIRINLVDKFNIAAFPHLAKKHELQSDITKTFEYKSFCTLIQKEVETARKMFKHYQEEADKYFKSQPSGQHFYNAAEFQHFELDLKKEIDSSEITISFLKKFTLKYCEDIKSQHLQLFLDKNTTQGNRYLNIPYYPSSQLPPPHREDPRGTHHRRVLRKLHGRRPDRPRVPELLPNTQQVLQNRPPPSHHQQNGLHQAQTLQMNINTIMNHPDSTRLSTPLMETFEVEQSPRRKVKMAKPKQGCCVSVKDCLLGPSIQTAKRKVFLNGQVIPPNKQDNMIKNSKYNLLTFFPLVLYTQFQQFTNLFYLGLSITQFIDPLKVGFLIDYIGPLLLVVSLSVLKELYDDIQRHKRDKQINNFRYNRITPKGPKKVTSGSLKTGMLIEVKQNQRIPADLLLLYADDEQGNIFIRTDQLDGETDWKLRKAVQSTQEVYTKDESRLLASKAYAKCAAPSVYIYDFYGVFVWKEEQIRESLSLENVLWANTVLANSRMIGLVIHCGRETRMTMNSREPKTKFGRIDEEINIMGLMLFIVMALLSGLITFLSGIPLDAGLIATTYIRYLILLSNIIPISMRVNLEFAKLIYSYKINRDRDIEGTITRNSNIPESLGRIQYLLSDKTGTITQNDMIFKKISLEQSTFTYENIPEMKSILREQCQLNQAPMSDLEQQVGKSRKGKLRRERDAVLRDLITALVVCHNVTPTVNERKEREFQASSPDEIALVKIGEELGLELVGRDQGELVVRDMEGKRYTFEILNNFPFSSESKRMGIVVRHVESGRHMFYLKGADTVMKQFISEVQRGFVDEECENLAREGLRTLVVSQKLLGEEEYARWRRLYEKANEKLENRAQEVRKVVALLESGMEFLGITGVEDKLQEDVCQTLENIRHAGINVWMLTGDKVETAICIAISSGIKSATQEVYLIKEVSDEVKLQMQLNAFDTLAANTLLVIDGTSLETALQHHRELFFQITSQAQSVVCCRCSPTQKAQVAECIRSFTRKVVACIGDGGNDVGMIQQSDVGIGIEGKEGKQAALASDFSITKFRHLNILLFWHGRLSYKRSALLSQFVIHRGLIITVIQTQFMIIFYFLSISIFSGGLILGYATLYTMFPVFAIIFDEDVDQKIALSFTPLYKSLQKSRDLNAKTFMIWWWKSIFSGTVIMVLALVMFKDIFLQIETVAFTALIFYQYVMTITELHSLHVVMIVSNIGSALLYVLTIYFFPQQLVVARMNANFFLYVAVIVLCSWLPLFLSKLLLRKLDPSDFEKIMKNVKRNKINTRIFN